MTIGWIHDALVIASIGATVLVCVALLRLFFDLRAAIRRRGLRNAASSPERANSSPKTIGCGCVIEEGKTYDGLRYVWAIDADAMRDAGLPQALGQMIVFERADASRVWIDAAAIRTIVTVPTHPEGTSP